MMEGGERGMQQQQVFLMYTNCCTLMQFCWCMSWGLGFWGLELGVKIREGLGLVFRIRVVGLVFDIRD